MFFFSGANGRAGKDPLIAEDSRKSLDLWKKNKYKVETEINKYEFNRELGVFIHRQQYTVRGARCVRPGHGGHGGLGGIGGPRGELLVIGLDQRPTFNSRTEKGNR